MIERGLAGALGGEVSKTSAMRVLRLTSDWPEAAPAENANKDPAVTRKAIFIRRDRLTTERAGFPKIKPGA